mmetsp:Transcript_28774/g.21444  ORF Transcript_28774/g.21444 Transcript_28774/m.21444 type:complete len:108 (-) Transcript_28774:142-465(-)
MKYNYGTFTDNVYNTSRFISGLSETLIHCTALVEDTQTYLMSYLAEFDYSLSEYGSAVLNQGYDFILKLWALSDQLSDSNLSGQEEHWYATGMLINLLLTINSTKGS